jgi:hypothetical protein
MRATRQQAIRECLKNHGTGLTRQELSDMLKIEVANVATAIKAMPDVYVDRWITGRNGQFRKVYCVVEVPEDCPHPTDRVYTNGRPVTTWRQLQA